MYYILLVYLMITHLLYAGCITYFFTGVPSFVLPKLSLTILIVDIVKSE
jgi:hypothetical protein